MGPKSSDEYPFKRERERFDTQTSREDGHVKMEADIGGMPPQTKEGLEPPEAGRDQSVLPSSLQRAWPADSLILDFGPPKLRENHFLSFKPPRLW